MAAKIDNSGAKNAVKGIFDNFTRGSSNPGSGASWGDVDPTTLTKLVDTITSRGGAIRLGYTRDGGAYAVGFYYGDEATTQYCRPSEDLDEFLGRWIEFYQNLPNTHGVSPSQGRK